MIFDPITETYFQLGIVAGGINLDQCGIKNFPVVFTKLDNPEIFDFVSSFISGDG